MLSIGYYETMDQRRHGKKLPNAMWYVQTATKLELTRESKKMYLEDRIREILFEIGKDIKIHKIDNDNSVIEIDYEKYVKLILRAIDSTP